MAADNILVKNLGLHPTPSFNFMLRVEALFDLPCKAVRAFTKANEFEYIQEGGLNDYVHMRRKPITQPFTFEVDRYVGVDYFDPLPLGSEPILPVCLLVFGGAAYRENGTTTFLRMYTFTACKVMEKTYGELNAEQSGLYVETTKLSYHECIIVTNPSIYDLGGKQTTYKEDLELDTKTNIYKANTKPKYARTVPDGTAGKTINRKADGSNDAAGDNLNRGRYDPEKNIYFAVTPPESIIGHTGGPVYDDKGNKITQTADDNMHRGRYDAANGGKYDRMTFTKNIMGAGKFALTPPNDKDRAERHIYSPEDDTHYANRVSDSVIGRSGRPILDENGKDIKQTANDNVNRGRYTDSKRFALQPAAPEEGNTDLNRGRYDAAEGQAFSRESFTRDIMKTPKYASVPANNADRAERHLYDQKSDKHYAKRVSDLSGETTPEVDDLNRGRYDAAEGGTFSKEGFTREIMKTPKYASIPANNAERAERRIYTEGDSASMSHIDAASYLNRR